MSCLIVSSSFFSPLEPVFFSNLLLANLRFSFASLSFFFCHSFLNHSFLSLVFLNQLSQKMKSSAVLKKNLSRTASLTENLRPSLHRHRRFCGALQYPCSGNRSYGHCFYRFYNRRYYGHFYNHLCYGRLLSCFW